MSKTSKEGYVVLDLDGTVRQSPAGREPVAPPLALGWMLHSLQGSCWVAAATGASLESVKITEDHLAFRFDLAAASYGGRVEQRNGCTREFYLVPDEEQRELDSIVPHLKRIAFTHRGKVTDENKACFSFHLYCKSAFQVACQEVEAALVGRANLKFLPTEHDFGSVVAAASSRKQLVVEFIASEGLPILVAAGDAEADLPLLEAAIWPIVTLTQKGAAINQKLVEVVKAKGCGYVAKADEPHAIGLLAGLGAAHDAGVICL